jgi:Aromatic-ring-opening dioxygenase LigAB, LigA subunit
MSLYYLQKLLYQLNRDSQVRRRFGEDVAALLQEYPLTEEERRAVLDKDIGLLYVMGVNGQLLMHYAAMAGLEWKDYIQAMRDGVAEYGPVRSGLYRMTDGKGVL